MKNQLLRFFFLLFLGACLCSSAGTAVKASLEPYSASHLPHINLRFEKQTGGSEARQIRSFTCSIGNIQWAGERIRVYMEGTLKEENGKSILEVTSGRFWFGPATAEDFSLYAIYSDGVITLSYFQTKSFIITGGASFSKAAFCNIVFDIKGINLQALNKLCGIDNFPFQGNFRGKVRIQGDGSGFLVKGGLQAYDGSIEEYEFNSAFLNFEGTYPFISLFDSYAVFSGRNVEINGMFNLARLYSLPDVNSKTEAVSMPELQDMFVNGEDKSEANSAHGFFMLSDKQNSLTYKLGTGSFLRLSLIESKSQFGTILEF